MELIRTRPAPSRKGAKKRGATPTSSTSKKGVAAKMVKSSSEPMYGITRISSGSAMPESCPDSVPVWTESPSTSSMGKTEIAEQDVAGEEAASNRGKAEAGENVERW